jgi:hypothetical protein
VERLARDKPSSLLQKSINYSNNMFYSTGPRCNCLFPCYIKDALSYDEIRTNILRDIKLFLPVELKSDIIVPCHSNGHLSMR